MSDPAFTAETFKPALDLATIARSSSTGEADVFLDLAWLAVAAAIVRDSETGRQSIDGDRLTEAAAALLTSDAVPLLAPVDAPLFESALATLAGSARGDALNIIITARIMIRGQWFALATAMDAILTAAPSP